MSKFDSYFLMSKQDILEYVRENTELFADSAALCVTEIGNGNMNYVYRIVDLISTKSLVIKQAGEHTRISEDIAVSTHRSTIEAEMLIHVAEFAPDYVPKVYQYDIVMHCIIMEDFTDYSIMRDALLNYEIFPEFSNQISYFLVRTLISTTDLVLNHIEKKKMIKRFLNPHLCEITETFVFTEPFHALSKLNSIYEPNMEFITREVFDDKKLQLEITKLKFKFMNHPQALLHGDLHTGSIFVKDNSIAIFDHEFAFFGPIGFDIGNIVANLIFAWFHAEALLAGENQQDYLNWLETTISNTIDLFIVKFREEFDKRATEATAKVDGFLEYYLDHIMKDTAAYAGIEMMRRIIGMAHVKDITSLPMNKRIRAERVMIKLAKYFIFHSKEMKKGKDFILLINACLLNNE